MVAAAAVVASTAAARFRFADGWAYSPMHQCRDKGPDCAEPHWTLALGLYGYVPIAGSVLTYLTRLQDPTIVEWVPDYLPIVYLGSWPSYRIKLGGPAHGDTGFTYKEDGVKARRV